jgi:hypothetical protein
MARTTQKNTRSNNRGRKSNRGRSVSAASVLQRPLENLDLRKLNGGGYKRVIRGLYNNPISLYVAGTVGAFFLGRFAYRYYQDHPEISDFIRENIDTVESRLREFRGGATEEEMAH